MLNTSFEQLGENSHSMEEDDIFLRTFFSTIQQKTTYFVGYDLYLVVGEKRSFQIERFHKHRDSG